MKLFKQFANTSNKVGTFMSTEDSETLVTTDDLDLIQDSSYEAGFFDKATLEQLMTLGYTIDKKTKLIQQYGATLPYLATVTYKQYARVVDSTTGDIYQSIFAGDNIGNALTNATYWKKILAGSATTKAFAINDSDGDITTNGTNTVSIPAFTTTSANGTFEEISSSDITGLTSNGIFNIIYNFETATNEAHLQSTFTESYLTPSGGSDGDYWILINPLTTYKKISGVWTEYQFTIRGEFTRTAGVIATPITYSINRRSIIDWFAVSVGSTYTKNHNIGSKFINTKIYSNSTATFTNCVEVDGGLRYLRVGYYDSNAGSRKQYPTINTVTVGGSSTTAFGQGFIDSLGNTSGFYFLVCDCIY